MKKKIRNSPFFLVLLPFFFVLHGFAENTGFIGWKDLAGLLLVYSGAALLLFAAGYLFYRKSIPSALLAFYLVGIYLFFGFIQDKLKVHLPVLARYRLLLPAFAAIFVLLAWRLYKSRHSFSGISFFLNMLLLIYIGVDLVKLQWKSAQTARGAAATGYSGNYAYKACKGCSLPDIYFLLFDAYTGSLSLRERYRYDNEGLDSFFVQRGFSLQHASRGNYYFTAFSMASMLNMSYLLNITDKNAVTTDDYNRSVNLIKNNQVAACLAQQGYQVINYSVFDLAGSPAPVNESYLPVKTKLITAATLLPRLQKDLGWQWAGNTLYKTRNNNEQLMESVKKESLRSVSAPRFIYAHIYLPHAPFYYDEQQQPKKEPDIARESAAFSLPAYLAYLPYTNRKIKELVTTILQNTGGKAVIVFMSDHGFNNETIPVDSFYTFQNQNAVYFPGKDYHLLYDSITGVNQFRVLFNTLFKQQYPLLKDSVVLLKDKK